LILARVGRTKACSLRTTAEAQVAAGSSPPPGLQQTGSVPGPQGSPCPAAVCRLIPVKAEKNNFVKEARSWFQQEKSVQLEEMEIKQVFFCWVV
jgi:hypothetical protein